MQFEMSDVKTVLEAGGRISINAATGECTAKFSRDDYTEDGWAALQEALGIHRPAATRACENENADAERP